jgi:cobalt-precorrin 5A hydrolase
MSIGIIAFTENGNALLEKIVSNIDENFIKYNKNSQDVKLWLREIFYKSSAIIFIGAIGIATRLISSLISSKDTDPAVIVIDELGRFVIPILSGHIGGANELSRKLASKLNATPVITTATDINNKFAVDVWSSKNGLVIDDISKIKNISSKILKDEKVGLYSDFEIFGDISKELTLKENCDTGICVSLDPNKKPYQTTLNIIPKIITIGVGCRKDTRLERIEEFILETLKINNISLKAVKYLASIDLKKEEKCLVEFANKYHIEFTTFSAEELNNVAGSFEGSEFVKATTGVDNVCERSAVLQSNGKLILEKTAKNGMTIAIAISKWRCEF